MSQEDRGCVADGLRSTSTLYRPPAAIGICRHFGILIFQIMRDAAMRAHETAWYEQRLGAAERSYELADHFAPPFHSLRRA